MILNLLCMHTACKTHRSHAGHNQTYPYSYPFKLLEVPSTYTVEKTLTNQPGLPCVLEVFVQDYLKDTLPLALIKYQSRTIDTAMRTDMDGKLFFKPTLDSFQLQAHYGGNTSISTNYIVPEKGTVIRFTFTMGTTNWDNFGRLESKIPLNQEMLDQLIYDLTYKQKNPLLENKTVITLWEI